MTTTDAATTSSNAEPPDEPEDSCVRWAVVADPLVPGYPKRYHALMMLTLGPIPRDLQTTIESLIVDARANDPDRLLGGDSLFITGGPAWCNSISPDGTIWIHDYSDNPAVVLTDDAAKIKTVVIAGKQIPEFLTWLPKPTESDSQCAECAASGWQRLGGHEFVCETCSGLGWLPGSEIA